MVDRFGCGHLTRHPAQSRELGGRLGFRVLGAVLHILGTPVDGEGHLNLNRRVKR